MEWKFDGEPDAPGWYAALVCYEPEEGAFPMAAEWDGRKWLQKAVVLYGERRDTKEAAEQLAYDNDPDAGANGIGKGEQA